VAVVVAKYIQPNAKAKGTAKENIKYIENRPGKDGARIIRTLFGNDGRMSRQEAYELIDNAEPGSVFWRMKISPDAVKEDTYRDVSMQEITERMINTLQEKLGKQVSYIAAIHADHRPFRHIHVLAKLPKLSREEFQRLPDILIHGATEAALDQRRELDLVREHREREKERKEREWQREL